MGKSRAMKTWQQLNFVNFYTRTKRIFLLLLRGFYWQTLQRVRK